MGWDISQTTRNTRAPGGAKNHPFDRGPVAGIAIFTLITNVTHPVRKARSLWQETRVGPPAIAPPGPLAPAEPPSGHTIQTFKVSKSPLDDNGECSLTYCEMLKDFTRSLGMGIIC